MQQTHSNYFSSRRNLCSVRLGLVAGAKTGGLAALSCGSGANFDLCNSGDVADGRIWLGNVLCNGIGDRSLATDQCRGFDGFLDARRNDRGAPGESVKNRRLNPIFHNGGSHLVE